MRRQCSTLGYRLRPLLAVLALVTTPLLQAAGSGTLSVTATVLSKSNCKFTSGTATLAFGSIDPSSTSSATASATFIFKCGGSAAIATWTVTAGDGLYSSGPGARRMRHATDTSEFIAYSLDLPASGTVPKNVDYTLTVNGTIAPADFQNAIAGAYSDTVAIDVTP